VISQQESPFELGPMPLGSAMETIDERLVGAPVAKIFELAREVESWPVYLPHYRYVRFRSHRSDGGGLVEMSAYRPFQLANTWNWPIHVNWPTWWLSEMAVDTQKPAIRFRHVGGITKGMEVEWSFAASKSGTHVRILHLWNGPPVPLVGIPAAVHVIGPIFVHGIASRTLAGLSAVAERSASPR
jgi:ribosome-associated toxin RatA of RatAB toxin-antitoxin module